MSIPVTTERKSLLPLRLRAPCVVGSSPTTPMPSVSDNNNNKSPLSVGNRVLVNGLKTGTLRYIGTVKFATGLFCGVELDQPEGKHDGQIKDVRYFQCPANHGIFVPRDKVVLASRTRTLSTQRPVSRLKAPTLTRSITLTSSINKIELSKSVELPDILANTNFQPPVTQNNTTVNENHEITIVNEQRNEQTIDIITPKIEFQPLTIDEPPETIEADFTDSVSLILHQLQQDQNIETRSSSITISEEDDGDDDNDDDDNESAIVSTVDEPGDKNRLSSSSSALVSVDLGKFVQTDLSFPSKDNISFTKVEILDNNKKPLTNSSVSINKLGINSNANTNKKKPTTASQPIRKPIEQRSSPGVVNTTKRPVNSTTTRTSSIVPPKKLPPPKIQLNAAQSVASLPSQSKLSLSLSSCNSLNSSQSDLISVNKSSNTKQTSDTDLLVDLLSTNTGKVDEFHQHVNLLNQQLLVQQNLNQSLQINNENLKKYYQHLLKQFDLMYILNQFYITENDRIQKQHQFQLSKARTTHDQLKTSIENLRLSHKHDLSAINKRYHNEIENLNKTHEHKSVEYQQRLDRLLEEKSQLEARCSILQEKVDGFLTEMANSEHADVLLCHVETLEKDRTSLQTVLELKNKEITQLRTKLNEQEIQLNDEKALRKRVDMADNQNQNLLYLLRQKKLSEKAAIIERNVLKEQVAQLERDNCQLKFENETLRYRLRERSLSISIPSDNQIILPTESIAISSSNRQGRNRACSLPSIIMTAHENERITRSLPLLNCILNR